MFLKVTLPRCQILRAQLFVPGALGFIFGNSFGAAGFRRACFGFGGRLLLFGNPSALFAFLRFTQFARNCGVMTRGWPQVERRVIGHARRTGKHRLAIDSAFINLGVRGGLNQQRSKGNK